MSVPNKSRKGGGGAKFVKSGKGGTKVRTGKDGGKNLGTPTHCVAQRGHANVRSY